MNMKQMTSEIPAICDTLLDSSRSDSSDAREALLRIVCHLEAIYQGRELERWPDTVLGWHLAQIQSILGDSPMFNAPYSHRLTPYITMVCQRICLQLSPPVADATCTECGATVKGGGLCYACRFQPSWGQYEPDTGP